MDDSGEIHVVEEELSSEEYQTGNGVGSHATAVLDSKGKWRCPTCKASAFDKSVLEEIQCKEDEDGLKPGTHKGDTEPPFPSIGDIWWETPSEYLWVRVENADGDHVWVTTGGYVRSGQMSLPGTGFNRAVQEVRAYVKYADLSNGDPDLRQSIINVRHNQLEDRIEDHVEKYDMFRVTPVQFEADTDTGLKRIISLAKTRAIRRPRPGKPG